MLSIGLKVGIRIITPDGYAIPITNYCTDPVITSGPGGFQSFTDSLALSKYQAFYLYSRGLGGDLTVSWGGRQAWAGRIEDLSLDQRGVKITALGAWRALADFPITMVLSHTNYSDWRPLNQIDNVNADPSRAYFDFNNRLYLAPNKNASLDTTHWAGVGYRIPNKGLNLIERVTFDYKFLAASGHAYTADFRRRLYDWTNVAPQLWTISGTGSLQTGSVDIATGGAEALSFMAWRASATPEVYTGETGDFYLEITNLRLYGLDQTTITASDIIKQAIGYVSGVNPGQLSGETGQVKETGLDLEEAIYEDELAIDIIPGLETLGDDQTPPRYWRASVWEGKRVTFAPVGEGAKSYQVNFGDLTINRSVDTAYTGFYGAYNSRSGGEIMRTDQANNDYALRRLGFSRVAKISISTTSAAQAQKGRDAAVEDSRYSLPFSSFTVRKIFSSLQTAVPLYLPRPGDNVTIRNWPPILGAARDRVRTFRILETALRLKTGELTITPEVYPRSLDQMLARRDEGIY
jgi:hypothetical protein